MSLGTVKALLADPHTTDDTQIYACGYGSIAVADLRELAAKAEQANAMVAAAYDAAAEKSRESCVECGGSGERDTGGTMPWGAPALVACDCDTRIRALTPADAKAALDRIVQEAVREALQVKPLVWDGFRSDPYYIEVSDGGMAHLYNNADRDEDGNIDFMQGGYLTLVSVDDLKAVAQADYERRILASLKGGEA